MTDTNAKIGRLIYQIRQERGLTQAEFARRLGTSQSAANRIEHGKQNLSIKTLERISQVLDYDLIGLNDFGQPQIKITRSAKTGEIDIRIKDRQ